MNKERLQNITRRLSELLAQRKTLNPVEDAAKLAEVDQEIEDLDVAYWETVFDR